MPIIDVDLVSATIGVGARYRALSQGEDPFCQTYSARWIRWKAKNKPGKDMLVKYAAAAGQWAFPAPAGRLGDQRGYTIQAPEVEYKGAKVQLVSVDQNSIKEEFRKQIAEHRESFRGVNNERVIKYIEGGKGYQNTIKDGKLVGQKGAYLRTDRPSRQILLHRTDSDVTIEAKDDHWSDKLCAAFRTPDRFWYLRRLGDGLGDDLDKGHAMAAYNRLTQFYYFDPVAGEFEMSIPEMERWVRLDTIKQKIVGPQKVHLLSFCAVNSPEQEPVAMPPRTSVAAAVSEVVEDPFGEISLIDPTTGWT
jgi:hypothetical protein